MKYIYTIKNAEIVSLEVVLELGNYVYCKEIDQHGLLARIKKEDIGDKVFATFKECKEARLELLGELQEKLNAEIKSITKQTKAKVVEPNFDEAVLDPEK